jgi:RNA polymerase sigma factor (sigma-70 family)
MASFGWPQLYAALIRDPGDDQAWLDLEERVEQLVHQRLSDLDPIAAQDAVAEICVQVVTDLTKARGPETFQGFVYGQFLTVRRRTLAQTKTRRSEVPIEGLEFPNPPQEDPGDRALAALQQCLDTLPRRDRSAVELRYFQQATPLAIASALSVSEGNARRIVYNGLTRLRSCMGMQRA